MRRILIEGVTLDSVVTPPAGEDGCGVYQVGSNSVTSIIVREENGQMAPVPWALVEFSDDRKPVFVNLANVESVTLDNG